MVFQICRVYTKCIKDGKNKVRLEHQEYPDQEYADALARKLFLDGRLVVLGEEANNKTFTLDYLVKFTI